MRCINSILLLLKVMFLSKSKSLPFLSRQLNRCVVVGNHFRIANVQRESFRQTNRFFAQQSTSQLSPEKMLEKLSFKGLPKFQIVDSTLREGEQFCSAEFKKQDRVYIAKMLDKLGVDYIELVNPIASSQAARDCEAISELGLKAKIVAHTRCHMSDVKAAVATGIGKTCFRTLFKNSLFCEQNNLIRV